MALLAAIAVPFLAFSTTIYDDAALHDWSFVLNWASRMCVELSWKYSLRSPVAKIVTARDVLGYIVSGSGLEESAVELGIAAADLFGVTETLARFNA